MDRIFYEVTESIRIAMAQIRANKMRSALTALGVIIGIVAVTLMGTAINGIDIGFDRSLAMLGEDILYVQKWPWHNVEDWWNYANRPPFRPEDADALNRIFDATPNTLLEVALPVAGRAVHGQGGPATSVGGVYTFGTNADYGRTITADFQEGRLFNDTEAKAGRQVCVLGLDVADALFPGRSAIGPGGADRGPAVPRHRRPREAGLVPRALQLRQPDGDAARAPSASTSASATATPRSR